MEKKDISRRDFLKGAGAVAVGIAAMSVFGGCGSPADAAGEAAAGGISGAPGDASNRTILAFASDQHAETAGFEAWLKDQLAVYGDELSFLSYGGDVCDKNWDQATFDGFKAVLDTLMPGRYSATTGNQEHKPGAPVWDEIGPGFTRLGEVLATGDYIIYHFGAAQEAMNFPDADIEALSEYLASAPNNIPIFIVSHYPLHLSIPYTGHDIPGGYRQAKNNGKLIELLNGHPNVIFLWGHNHTFKDPRYGTIRPTGSKFTYEYEDVTKKAEIKFVYANLGSFCRGDTYGVIAEVGRSGDIVTVKLCYVDTDVPMETKESAVITYAADGTVTADVTTSESTNYVDMFCLAGWFEDPSFMEDY